MHMISMALLSPQDTQSVDETSTLHHHIHRSFADALPIREAWDTLASQVGDIMCSFDWCRIWWDHFHGGRRLEIHTLHDGLELVAVLPLFRETIHPGGVSLRTVRVLGCDYTIETATMAVRPEYAEAFTSMLLQALSRREPWDVLQIAPIRPYHAAFDAMVAACAVDEHAQTILLDTQDSACMSFPLPSTYEQYLHSLCSSDRCNLLRRERKLREKHYVEINVAQAPREVDQAMDAVVYWHQRLWTEKGKPGQFGGVPAVEHFHRAIARHLATAGRLALITLKVDGRVLGADYACCFGSRMHGLFRGYCRQEPWRRLGLGLLLHARMVCLAIERGATEIDAGRGLFDYKRRFGAVSQMQRCLVVIRRGWSSRLRFWAALRTAYLIHVLYSRLWIDMIAPRLNIRPRGRHFHVRYSMLAQLYRRTRFALFGGPAVLHMRYAAPRPQQDCPAQP